MATQNLTGVDALLKNVYRGPWVEQLNQETQILDILEKTDANNLGTFSSFGRQLIFPVHSSRNRGRGSVTDGGQLPTAGTQGFLDAIVGMKYFASGIEVTDQAIKQSKSDEGSFVRALTMEMDQALIDMKKDVTRIAYGTGDGLLGSCTTTQATVNTFAVDTGQFIAVGDTVDVIVRSSGATGTGAVARTVTAVAYTGTANSATQTNANITISGAAISVDNTYGVYVSGDRSQESDGLRNICSTGRTLHQINSSTNPFWDSNIKDFAQANPSEDGIMALAQTIRQRSGKTPDLGMLTLGGQRRLANTYASQKRWNDDNVTKPAGGYAGAIPVSAGGTPIPMLADVDCPAGQGFLLNKQSFAWAQLGPPDWLESPDGKGSIMVLKDGSSLGTKSRVWQAWIAWDAVLVTVAPNRNGKFININDDIPVARL
ncbi:MAG TPA: phage major capsid protein [Bacteroidota bacterium]